jgi:hypothetical protein
MILDLQRRIPVRIQDVLQLVKQPLHGGVRKLVIRGLLEGAVFSDTRIDFTKVVANVSIKRVRRRTSAPREDPEY